MKFIEYAGMSYEQASREGLRLIVKANDSGNWFAILDRLVELREIMQREFEKCISIT